MSIVKWLDNYNDAAVYSFMKGGEVSVDVCGKSFWAKW